MGRISRRPVVCGIGIPTCTVPEATRDDRIKMATPQDLLDTAGVQNVSHPQPPNISAALDRWKLRRVMPSISTWVSWRHTMSRRWASQILDNAISLTGRFGPWHVLQKVQQDILRNTIASLQRSPSGPVGPEIYTHQREDMLIQRARSCSTRRLLLPTVLHGTTYCRSALPATLQV